MESLFHQLSGSTLIFVKSTHQKAANLTFHLISPVGMVPWSEIYVNSHMEEKKTFQAMTCTLRGSY